MLKIPTNLLNAIHQFAAKNDRRSYINGVYLEIKTGVLRLVATNGAMVACCALKDSYPDLPDQGWLMPNKMVNAVLESKETQVRVTIRPDSVKDGVGATISADVNGAQMSYRSIEGSFPQWRQVLENAYRPEAPANLDAKLLGIIAKASKISGSSKLGYFGLRQQGNSNAMFSIEGANIIGAIAPLNPTAPTFNAELFDDVVRRTFADDLV